MSDYEWMFSVADTIDYGIQDYPEACVGLLVDKARAHLVPGLVLACFCVGWVCRLCECDFYWGWYVSAGE